ncbi:MAG: radical SAM protein [Oscillospiraceae bacterium]|nr:radical SAM protein [Oscillospiraceae bacterium]
MYKSGRLGNGGIMTNYRCTAACRHCCYACSPTRAKGYITREMSGKLARQLVSFGCRAVHIGGGEPFMDIDGLVILLECLRDARVGVDYVETNAFWATDEEKIGNYLERLLAAGADTLCISLDPYHAEYVPYARPLRLAMLCREYGARFFLWREEFLPMLKNLDMNKAHNREAMERAVSPSYIYDTAKSYGIGYGGRAINIEEEYFPVKPTDSLLDTKPCTRALSGAHYHVDLYGKFVPSCTGLSVPLEEAVGGLPRGKYPVMEAVLSGGADALMSYAKSKGFIPEAGYTSKCAMCFYIRRWLCENAPSPELDAEHYTASLEYY